MIIYRAKDYKDMSRKAANIISAQKKCRTHDFMLQMQHFLFYSPFSLKNFSTSFPISMQ